MGFQHGSIRRSSEDIDVEELGLVDYEETWKRQAELAAQRANGEIRDRILLLQHPPTYTAGKRTEDSDRPTNGLPVVDVDRGGRITWHGPGQLVAYPLIQLADPVDVVDYVRRLEQALIETCRGFGLDSVGRVEGRSGVWLPAGIVDGQLQPARKIAAIGILVAVFNQLLIRSGREEQAMMTTLAGLIVVLMMIVNEIDALFQAIKSIFQL